MMMIDLPSLGAKTFQKIQENLCQLRLQPRTQPRFEDLFQLSLINTGIVFAPVSLPLAATSVSRESMQESLLLFHPVHGVWLTFFNSSSKKIPHIQPHELEGFLQAWQTVEEELLWDEIPMRAILIFKNLEEDQCVADFSHAPFPVFFKDTIHQIPQKLQTDLSLTRVTDRDATVNLDAISALGALSVVAEIQLEGLKPLTCHHEQLVEVGKQMKKGKETEKRVV